jgi:hypothetical protein
MRILLVLAVFILTSCASALPELLDESGKNLLGAPRVYTLVNLHPDEERSKLYAANFLQRGLIPMCSEVKLVELNTKRLIFRLLKRDKQYLYVNHKAAGEPFERHLIRYFGQSCNSKIVQGLSKADQAGIKRGRVSRGMTKSGVIYAIGYPPRHVTPDLEVSEWTYWQNRFNRKIVIFDDAGVVTEVRD